jgi:hypothetical protein
MDSMPFSVGRGRGRRGDLSRGEGWAADRSSGEGSEEEEDSRSRGEGSACFSMPGEAWTRPPLIGDTSRLSPAAAMLFGPF